jgi:PIN domain nuclease of toxin-antitoxin system
MKYLLDTHTFLWFINDSDQIPEATFNLSSKLEKH